MAVTVTKISPVLATTVVVLLWPALLVLAADGYYLYSWFKGCPELEEGWGLGGLGLLFSINLLLLASLLRNLVCSWRLQRGVRGLLPLEEARVAALRQCLPELNGIALRFCTQDVPHLFTVGWWRPTVVLSRWILSNLDKGELLAALAHELAHIQHRDNLLSFWVHSLCPGGFGLPLFRELLTHLTALLEQRADRAGAAIVSDRLAMASALVKVGRSSLLPPIPLEVSSFTGEPSLLRRRIAALLGKEEPVARVRPRAWVWLAAFALCCLLLVFQAYGHPCPGRHCEHPGVHEPLR